MKVIRITMLLGVVVFIGLLSLNLFAFAKNDSDNNPPGPVGGAGTNWENPPGAQGGPGASPDKKRPKYDADADLNHDGVVDIYEKKKAIKHRVADKDNNPPGLAGGAGTNWENPPGPQGGPGASPDRKHYGQDKDNNPPGPAGGRGTNWENPPGPQGGPGASPNRRHKK